MNVSPRNPQAPSDSSLVEDASKHRSRRIIPAPKSGDSLFGGWGPRLL